MRISETGLALIVEFEGCKLEAYKCPADVWTIGVGHTGPDVKPGLKITRDQAMALLAGDCRRFEDAVSKLVTVTLSQPQFDALVSFAFNVGSGALGKSTLLKRLNAGDYTGAAAEFGKWNKGGGRVLNGLVRRRDREAALFLSGIGRKPVQPSPASPPAPAPSTPTSSEPGFLVRLFKALFKKGS